MSIKPPGADKPALYTDLNELNKIRQLGQEDNSEALKKVADQFEQMFLSMLMKSMREANRSFGEDNFMNSSQVQFYEGMLDDQMTSELAGSSGIGLSEVLVKQLTRSFGDSKSVGEATSDPETLAQQMMNRSINTTASLAASAVLGKAQRLDETRPTPELAPGQNAAQAIMEASLLMPASSFMSQTSDQQSVGSVDLDDVNFDTPEDFVKSLMPVAKQVAAEIGVDPKVLLAQAALETGWGKFVIGQNSGSNSHNLFNIKADSRWSGEAVAAQTTEFIDGVAVPQAAEFRRYESYQDSFRDYVDFIKTSPRYAQALEQVQDPHTYIGLLQEAGYATDPEYATKVSRIFNSSTLNDPTSGEG